MAWLLPIAGSVRINPEERIVKLGMPLPYATDFRETVGHLLDFEAVGLDRVMAAEAYGSDAVTQLGYVAAMTSRVELQFGILPMYSRTSTNLAMTAAGLDYVSGGRCVLGIWGLRPTSDRGVSRREVRRPDRPCTRARRDSPEDPAPGEK